jgi:hypothetical protein
MPLCPTRIPPRLELRPPWWEAGDSLRNWHGMFTPMKRLPTATAWFRSPVRWCPNVANKLAMRWVSRKRVAYPCQLKFQRLHSCIVGSLVSIVPNRLLDPIQQINWYICIYIWLDDRGVGVRVAVESRIFSSPDRPDRLWGPTNLLFNGYRGLFPRG